MPAGRFPVTGKAPSQYVVPTTGPVTPREIYQLLLNAGYSTHQAVGIMANMINESGFNPEAVGDSGHAHGLVQWEDTSYPRAASLVTGNPQKDVRAQIRYLTQSVPRNAVAGATSAQVAGNFARNFERCTGCQPGGAQFVGRVANVAKVSRWVSSNKWPTKASGQSGFPAAGTGVGLVGAQSDTCLLAAPSFIGFGGGCLFAKTQARALIGGAMLVGGAAVMTVGLAVLTAGAFSQTKAGHAAGKVVGTATDFVPGGTLAKGAKRAVRTRRASRAAGEAKAQRALGEPQENPTLRTGRGAVRESPQGTRRRKETGRDAARRMANASGNGSRERVPF